MDKRYKTLSIDVVGIAGSNIKDICVDMCDLANDLGLGVGSKVNGIFLYAVPGLTGEALFKDYEIRQIKNTGGE